MLSRLVRACLTRSPRTPWRTMAQIGAATTARLNPSSRLTMAVTTASLNPFRLKMRTQASHRPRQGHPPHRSLGGPQPSPHSPQSPQGSLAPGPPGPLPAASHLRQAVLASVLVAQGSIRGPPRPQPPQGCFPVVGPPSRPPGHPPGRSLGGPQPSPHSPQSPQGSLVPVPPLPAASPLR
jgi:hypothetical protein